MSQDPLATEPTTPKAIRRYRRIAYLVYILLGKHLPPTNRRRLGRQAIRALRGWCGAMMFNSCGRDVNVESGADFGKGKGISIGNRSGIGIRARLDSPVSIGNDVMMAPDVLIFTRGHRFNRLDIPMIDQGASDPKPVVIGNDVWIGERVIILPGVTVGDGAILGAGSVVRESVPPRAIIVGNPGQIQGYREAR